MRKSRKWMILIAACIMAISSVTFAEKIVIDTDTSTDAEISAAISKLKEVQANRSKASATAQDKETIYIRQVPVSAYVADVSGYSFSQLGEWGETTSVRAARGNPLKLKGDISDSYGIGFYFSGQAGKGDPFGIPWMGMLKLAGGSWTRGQGETKFTYNGYGDKYVEILVEKPSSITQVMTTPIDQNGQWSASTGITLVKVFFRTAEARDRYLDSLN